MTKERNVKKDYIVVCTEAKTPSAVKHLIACNESDIKNYVRVLRFGDEVVLHFIDIDYLNENGFLGINNTKALKLSFDGDKPINKFFTEVSSMLDKLRINGIEEELIPND